MRRCFAVLPILALMAVTGTTVPVRAGPCTARIAQVEQQISQSTNSAIGPSAPQSVGAQLGRQPTKQTVRDAELAADTLAQAALGRIKKADAAGNAAACNQALSALKEWYGL